MDDLNRSMQSLQDENAFLQRLLADPVALHPPTAARVLTAARAPHHRPAVMVAAGILLSRLVGLVRNRVFAHYFGTSDAADAFNAAFRIPNFLQNLFGEGVLSASFIPVYAGLRARGDDAEADGSPARWRRCSGWSRRRWCWSACWLTPWLIAVIAPGFEGEKRDADHPAGPHPLSGRRAAGPLGLVPRRPQQPPALLPQLRRAGALEPRDHREPRRVRAAAGSSTGWRRSPPGGRWRAACCSSASSSRRSRGCSRASGRASCAAPPQVRAGAPQLRAGVRRPGRGADQRLRRHRAREPAADRRRGRSLVRAGALHAAGEPVRHVGLGGRAAGDVERARDRGRARGLPPEPARRRAPADRVLRRPVGDGLSRARRRRRRRALPVGRVHPRDDRLRLGHPGRLRRRACSPRRWAGSTPPPTTRCTTPGRRSGSRVLRVALTIGLGYLFALPLPRRWASTRAGARRASRRRPASRAGSSSSCCGGALNRRIGADRPAAGLVARLWGAAAAAPLASAGAFGRRADRAIRSSRRSCPDRLRRGVFSGDRPSRHTRGTGGDAPPPARGTTRPSRRVNQRQSTHDGTTHSRRAPAQARHPPRRPRRLPVEGRDGESAVRRQGQAAESRVRSYFATDFDASPKNRLLQRLIADVETIVVPSEAQSLILENNLIKEYRPRFNVRLKDDKSYPSIAVTLAEPFPRVLVTRRRDIPGARYFGPVHRRRPAAAHARRSSAGSTPCGAVPTTCPPSGASGHASTTTSAAARRRAWAGRPRTTTAGWSTTWSTSSTGAPATCGRRCARP